MNRILTLAVVLLCTAPVWYVTPLFHRGATVQHLGDVTPALQAPAVPDHVGYHFRFASVFWVDLWTWGGEYCLYEGLRVQPIPRDEAARLLGDGAKTSPPFWYRYPPGFWLLAAILLCGARSLTRRHRPLPTPSRAAV